jgi:2-oxoglutarate dehydrogenase E2 component (dihydrolipoamide succinyltransferase)
VVAPAPPAPRDELTPQELATPAPVLAAVAPAAPAAAPQQAAPAPAAGGQTAAAPAASGGNLSDDQLLSFNDDQIDPADELLLLDENGNAQ